MSASTAGAIFAALGVAMLGAVALGVLPVPDSGMDPRPMFAFLGLVVAATGALWAVRPPVEAEDEDGAEDVDEEPDTDAEGTDGERSVSTRATTDQSEQGREKNGDELSIS